MSLTKKHYEAIASIVKKQGQLTNVYNASDTLKLTAVALSVYFATDNPKFDHTRFLQACGVEQTVYKKCRHGVLEGHDLPKCRECDN